MNINRVIISGNLTAKPELRATKTGTPVAQLRIATNNRRKIEGEWKDEPNYFDVVVWGTQAQNAEKYLDKGAAIAIDGRLQWREWSHNDERRQSVEIVAENIQYLSRPKSAPAPDPAEQPDPDPAEDLPL